MTYIIIVDWERDMAPGQRNQIKRKRELATGEDVGEAPTQGVNPDQDRPAKRKGKTFQPRKVFN